MKRVFVELMMVYLMMIYMFQPYVSEVYALKSGILQQTLNTYGEVAATSDYGCFSPELVQKMKSELAQKLNISEASIEFKGTTSPVQRGEYIVGQVSIPSPAMWFFKFQFGTADRSPDRMIRNVTVMSEWVE